MRSGGAVLAAEAVGQLARAKGIALHLDVPAELPPLPADRDRLMQMLINLLSNAVKACPLGGTGRPVINARVETAASKPSFARALDHGRCAIPTTGFYEWSRGSEPQSYCFRAGNGLLYLAGLYRMFEGTPRFVVLTCPAVGQVAAVHNRQPVVLGQDELLRWLGDREAAEAILRRPGAALQGAPMEWEEL